MKLSIKAFACTSGFFFAGTVAVVGLVNMAVPGYGQSVLDLFSSLYPGYNASGTLTDWILGIVLAFADGIVGGVVFAWLYNRLSGGGS